MPITREILNSHSVATLRKEISKTNIKGYSKMPKAQLVEVMMQNSPRFSHIKMAEKKPRAPRSKPKAQEKPKEKDEKPQPKKKIKIKIKRKGKEELSAISKAIAGSDISQKVAKTKDVKPKAKEEKPKPKKKIKLNIKRKKAQPKKQEPQSLGKSLTGLSREQMNKLDPAELFGKLPAIAKLNILDPKTTGVKVGEAVIPKELLNSLEDIMEKEVGTEGFKNYLYQWSFYEGGNFGKRANEYWEKKSEQIDNYQYSNLVNDFLEIPNVRKVITNSIKKYARKDKFSWKEDYQIIKMALDDDGWNRNDDYEEYYAEDKYGLIYEDDEYYMSNKTRSRTNTLVKDVIENELKPELKQAKATIKEIKDYIKKDLKLKV